MEHGRRLTMPVLQKLQLTHLPWLGGRICKNICFSCSPYYINIRNNRIK